MSAALRPALSALGVAAAIALGLGGAVLTALSLESERAELAGLAEQTQALQAREKRLRPPPGRDLTTSPTFEARTITLAGAAMQQRVEAAVTGAAGRLISSKLDTESQAATQRLALAAELTIAEPDLQRLLFDLETGRPYLFVDALDARAPETPGDGGPMRVSLSLSGQWSAPK